MSKKCTQATEFKNGTEQVHSNIEKSNTAVSEKIIEAMQQKANGKMVNTKNREQLSPAQTGRQTRSNAEASMNRQQIESYLKNKNQLDREAAGKTNSTTELLRSTTIFSGKSLLFAIISCSTKKLSTF